VCIALSSEEECMRGSCESTALQLLGARVVFLNIVFCLINRCCFAASQ
jgi:hypothetical protein